MYKENTDLHLGTKAFVLFAPEKMKWALVLVAVALGLSIIGDAVKSTQFSTFVSVVELLTWLAVLGGLIWSWILYRNFTFSFEEFDVKMKSGIIEKKEISIPYRQIQSVDIVRSLSHQMLGLSKLVMLTAGHEEVDEHNLTEVVLEPLDKTFAEEIRNALQRKIGVQIVRPEIPLASTPQM